MKSKFYVTIAECEYWDTKGERATPNIHLDTKTCNTIDEAREVLTGLVSKYTNPTDYVADWIEFRCDHCDVRCIRKHLKGHCDFPIRTTVHAEINVLNNEGRMVPSSWFGDDTFKKMGA